MRYFILIILKRLIIATNQTVRVLELLQRFNRTINFNRHIFSILFLLNVSKYSIFNGFDETIISSSLAIELIKKLFSSFSIVIVELFIANSSALLVSLKLNSLINPSCLMSI